jgi:hypothetical protein
MSKEKAIEPQFLATISDNASPSGTQIPGADSILVVTGEVITTRGVGRVQSLEMEKLAVNVNLFIQHMGKLLENTPEKLGKFQFDELEIHAEISGDGTIAVLGSGIHAGMGGGLRFVFRRSHG